MRTSGDVWKHIWAYLRLDRKYLILAFVCAAGVSGMSGVVANLLEPFLDSAKNASTSANDALDLHRINLISLEIVGVYILRWFFTYGETVSFAEAGQRLGLRLRNAVYTHLQGLSLSFFNRQRTGALMSTINNDVPVLQGTVSGLKDIATGPFYVLGGLWAIFHTSVTLSLIALLVLPLMGYSISRLSRHIRQITGDTQNKLSDVNTLMEETLSGIRIIQSFGAERYTIERFRKENQSAKDLTMYGVRQGARLKPTTDLIGAAAVATALWVAGHMVATNELTLGQLGKFLFWLNLIASGIGSLGNARVTWEQLQGAGRRVLNNVLDVQSDVQNAPGAITLPVSEGRVEFRHVAFAYNADTPVLDDISFTMNPGEVVAVVGPSGAGKSTVADLIPRFYDPQAGEILVDGHDIRTVTVESLRHLIGIVPQETVLFGGTIRENIAFGNPAATPAMIEDAARAANAHEFIQDPRTLPMGYETLVGERGVQLSGGQRQRIAIARALLKDPRILILDEATSSLDSASEKIVQEALEKLMRGRTTLVIAHRLSTIQNAHKILVLRAGQIAEAGTHAELLRLPGGLYKRLYDQFYENERRHRDEDLPEEPASVSVPVAAMP